VSKLSLQLSTILQRLSKARRSHAFGFLGQLQHEQKAFREYYKVEGAAAASVLDDTETTGRLIDEASLVALVQLGEHWNVSATRPPHRPRSPFAEKIQSQRKPWWRLAFQLDCVRGKEPDRREVGEHPAYTPDHLVNRFIGECSIRLADQYHAQRIEFIHGKKDRSEEHDLLLQELASELPSFARIEVSDRFKEHQKIASTYRTVEPIRVAFKGEALVLLGQSAFEEEITGVATRTHIRGRDGKARSVEDVQSYIKQVAKLPAFGEWGKAQAPARVVALARAAQTPDVQGTAFTVNLTYQSFGMAQAVERSTGSAIQDRLRRYLLAEFKECPDFYFVVERGIGQLPHLHGAVSMDPTESNQKRLRAVLLKLTKAKGRRAPERWVDVEPLSTPARWGGYAIKHPLTSQSKTGITSLLYATQSLRAKARDEWEMMRQEQRDSKEVMKQVHASGK
jgi:hypothetical protein